MGSAFLPSSLSPRLPPPVPFSLHLTFNDTQIDFNDNTIYVMLHTKITHGTATVWTWLATVFRVVKVYIPSGIASTQACTEKGGHG